MQVVTLLKTKVEEKGLRLMDGSRSFRKKPEPPKKPSEGKVKKSIVSTFRPEIDVRGMIGEDAWFVIDKYLDDAALAGLKTVRLIHGKGTGALRNAVQQALKMNKFVKKYRLGQYGEGEDGVTIAEFG